MSKKISAKTLADVSCKIIKKRDIGNMMKMVHPCTIFIFEFRLCRNIVRFGTAAIRVRRGKVHTAYIKPVLKFLFMNRLILQPLLCVKCKGTRKQKDALYAAMGMSSMVESMYFKKAGEQSISHLQKRVYRYNRPVPKRKCRNRFNEGRRVYL